MDLAQLINDLEAATNMRVAVGVPAEEGRDPHRYLTDTSIVIGMTAPNPHNPRIGEAHIIGWLEEHADRYGYKVTASYTGAAILETIASGKLGWWEVLDHKFGPMA